MEAEEGQVIKHEHEHDIGCGWLIVVIIICVTAFGIAKLFVD